MMLSRKSLLLIGTSVAACVTAASMALAIMSGPAIGPGTRMAAGTAAACRPATWPYRPAECLKVSAAGKERPAGAVARTGGAS